MKGIILAGGAGTRLWPITKSISKQLLPIYDKPMIYYPLSILMLANITEILIITTPEFNSNFKTLLGDGSHIGINIEYMIQENPNGLPEAFVLGEEFIGDDDVCLILGDNIFYGDTFVNSHLIPAIEKGKPTIFGYYVDDSSRYGVIEFDEYNNVLSIEEKPKIQKSNYAITGLYMFNNDVVDIAKRLKPSERGETEIVDLINFSLDEENLNVELLGRGVAWLDTGTYASLNDASKFVEIIEQRQGLKIACLEEIAYQKNLINKEQLIKIAQQYKDNDYGRYLLRVANGN